MYLFGYMYVFISAVDSLLWSYEESWWALNPSDLDCDGILGKGDSWNATSANASEGGG